ncbi:hypothetical protein L873DRAFT_280238 [Choiromyces venosus 120613-1]|uniref:Uncharacterized protein n=1 Tax=Choiromyces venosus 120613-1 TaxID=1336337 RepID=A0A3N4JXP1_9PEZI|nr:hypothetical protein L873DRAFT_280238 [Choiromyces venosus 120613-1]
MQKHNEQSRHPQRPGGLTPGLGVIPCCFFNPRRFHNYLLRRSLIERYETMLKAKKVRHKAIMKLLIKIAMLSQKGAALEDRKAHS